jgi:hypothetical protein
MRKVSGKFVKKIKPHISFSIKFFKNRALYEVMQENIVKPAGPQTKI